MAEPGPDTPPYVGPPPTRPVDRPGGYAVGPYPPPWTGHPGGGYPAGPHAPLPYGPYPFGPPPVAVRRSPMPGAVIGAIVVGALAGAYLVGAACLLAIGTALDDALTGDYGVEHTAPSSGELRVDALVNLALAAVLTVAVVVLARRTRAGGIATCVAGGLVVADSIYWVARWGGSFDLPVAWLAWVVILGLGAATGTVVWLPAVRRWLDGGGSDGSVGPDGAPS